MFDLNKKEKPFTSFGGFGGGGLGLSGGVTKQLTYVDDVFSKYLYDGTGNAQTITNGIDLAGEGGLVWLKNRDANSDHRLLDTERGAGKVIYSSTSAQEATETNTLTSFNSNGFTTGGYLGTDDFASWAFRKAPGFFDVVTYTGDGQINRTVPHSLGSVPGMIVIKKTSGSGNWYTWHKNLGGTGKALILNGTDSVDTNSNLFSTLPTQTVFSPGDNSHTNQSGQDFVAYIFAHDEPVFGTDEDESIIHCGSFVGSASPFSVDIGFEPSWILFKIMDSSTRDWMLFDEMRPLGLRPNRNQSESSTFTSNVIFEPRGFRLVGQNDHNAAGETTIFMAIRRPNKPPEISTDVFAIDTGNSSSTIPAFDSGFPVDFALLKEYNTGANDNFTFNRLTGSRVMRTNTSVAEVNGGGLWIGDSNVGWSKQYNNTNISYMFKRAPGFMDVVAYTGTGSVMTINHNLNVSPQLVIGKKRSTTGSWNASVYLSGFTNGVSTGYLNGTNAFAPGTGNSFSAPVTSTTIKDNSNTSGVTYIAYLFATLPGISKVGSYSGTGNAINVDCGFTNGARFILIKRTDSSGDWYLWDTLRGIASGNDPYILLNSDATQVTNTDYVDPLSTGFTVTSSAPAALNVSGGTYLFLAIA